MKQTKKPKKKPRPAPKPDGKVALERMANLTRRIVAVPKEEITEPELKKKRHRSV